MFHTEEFCKHTTGQISKSDSRQNCGDVVIDCLGRAEGETNMTPGFLD